jgi:hypothetical protein
MKEYNSIANYLFIFAIFEVLYALLFNYNYSQRLLDYEVKNENLSLITIEEKITSIMVIFYIILIITFVLYLVSQFVSYINIFY